MATPTSSQLKKLAKNVISLLDKSNTLEQHKQEDGWMDRVREDYPIATARPQHAAVRAHDLPTADRIIQRILNPESRAVEFDKLFLDIRVIKIITATAVDCYDPEFEEFDFDRYKMINDIQDFYAVETELMCSLKVVSILNMFYSFDRLQQQRQQLQEQEQQQQPLG